MLCLITADHKYKENNERVKTAAAAKHPAYCDKNELCVLAKMGLGEFNGWYEAYSNSLSSHDLMMSVISIMFLAYRVFHNLTLKTFGMGVGQNTHSVVENVNV